MGSEKMKITIKQSTMVPPSKPTPTARQWNSSLDLIVGRIHILTVYFYRPNGSPRFFDGRVMREALGNVLVSFFPMAGRLARDGNGRVEIDCNGEGVLFKEAEADCEVDDFGDFTPSPELRRLVPVVDYSGDISSYPLFIAQVTHFKCGGVALGCGVHHTLSDGISSLHFINTWSDITRGLSIAIPPFIGRTLLRPREPPAPTFDHVEYRPPPLLLAPLQTVESHSSPNNGSMAKGDNVHDNGAQQKTMKSRMSPKTAATAIVKLTSDQITRLKARAKNEASARVNSTYETLAAHLWRCACKARALPDDQVTKLYIATDGRARLNPPLPPGYLGNVVFTATPMARAGELLSEQLAGSVSRIHNTLTRMEDGYLRSALDYLDLQPDLAALIRGPNYFASPNLNINSWTQLPVHEADFGWGRPIHMGPASILYEGTIYVIPSPNKDRSITLAVCLDADCLPVFQKLLYDF